MKKFLCFLLALCAILPLTVFYISAETAKVTESENEWYTKGYRLAYSDAIYALSEMPYRYDRFSDLEEKEKAAYEYGYTLGYADGQKVEPLYSYENSEQRQVALEFERLVIDGKLFSYDDYPVDVSRGGPVILGVRESGVSYNNEITDDYYLYLYVYNPFASQFFTVDNENFIFTSASSVTYYLDESSVVEVVGGRLTSVSIYDGRFQRYCLIVDRSTLREKYNFGNERKFYFTDMNCTLVKYVNNKPSKVVSKVFDVSDSFLLSGTAEEFNQNSASGNTHSFITNLYSTYWRADNPIEELGSVYSQINTVYFTVPRSVYELYDLLYSVRAEFLQMKTTPMVITNSETLNNATYDVDVMRSPYRLDEKDSDGVLFRDAIDYYLSYGFVHFAQPPSHVTWSYGLVESKDLNVTESCNNISYYFYNPDLVYEDGTVFHEAVSGEELQNYIETFTAFYANLNSDYVHMPSEWMSKYGSIARCLYEELREYDLSFVVGEEWDLQEWKENMDWSFWDWIKGNPIGTFENTTIQKLEVIENPKEIASQYAGNYSGLSDAYYVAECDAERFYNYLSGNDDVVLMLRFAQTEYEIHELFPSRSSLSVDPWADGERAWLVQEYCFPYVDVTEVTFQKDGKMVTYNVIADPVVLYPGLDVKDDSKPLTPEQILDNTVNKVKDLLGSKDDLKEKALQILKIIGFILAAVAVIWLLVKFVVPFLSPIISAIVTVVTAPFKAISNRRKRKNDRKNE